MAKTEITQTIHSILSTGSADLADKYLQVETRAEGFVSQWEGYNMFHIVKDGTDYKIFEVVAKGPGYTEFEDADEPVVFSKNGKINYFVKQPLAAAQGLDYREDDTKELGLEVTLLESFIEFAISHYAFGNAYSWIRTPIYFADEIDDFSIKTGVTGVSFAQSTVDLAVGGTSTLAWQVEPNNASNLGVSLTSSDPTVATVNNAGLVTGVKAGTTTVTVTTLDGGFTATCVVTVA